MMILTRILLENYDHDSNQITESGNHQSTTIVLYCFLKIHGQSDETTARRPCVKFCLIMK